MGNPITACKWGESDLLGRKGLLQGSNIPFFGLDGGVLGVHFVTNHEDVHLKSLLFSVCVIFITAKMF